MDVALANSLVDDLRSAIGDRNVEVGADIAPAHFGDRTGTVPPDERPFAVVYPRSTEHVSAVMRLCYKTGTPVVPQGGLTGLSGGALPCAGCIVVALGRMDAIEEIDRVGAVMRVQAGVPLQRVQEAARDAGLMFPLDIGSRGSSQIGGNAATNAGGIRVLRYGMMRDLVTGIEVVLADGTVLVNLCRLLKNNSGLDLKSIFIGSEGILGIITRLVLRLYPQPLSTGTALCALADFDAAKRMLDRARVELGETLSAFEVMWPDFFALAMTETSRRPFDEPAGLYVLIEGMSADPAYSERLESCLAGLLADHTVSNAIVAKSESDARALWAIREPTQVYDKHFRPSIGFDVGVPMVEMEGFVADCRDALLTREPALRTIWYGHIADGNIHIGVKLDAGGPSRAEIERIVYAHVRDAGGVVSAEHGIGTKNRLYLDYSRTREEIGIMRSIKSALDPKGLLNRGKMI